MGTPSQRETKPRRERSRAEAAIYALGAAAGAVTFAGLLISYRPTPAEISMFQQERRSGGGAWSYRRPASYGQAVRTLFQQGDLRGVYQLSTERLEQAAGDEEAALFAAIAADRLRLPDRTDRWEGLRATVLRRADRFSEIRRAYCLGWAARGLGEFAEAERQFGELVAASAPMVAGWGGNTSESGRVLASGGDLYNLACYLALAGESDAALDMIDAAVEAGWSDAGWPMADPDLEVIRDHPRFRAAMDRAWSNLPSSP